jgi:hypothetical protein
MANALIIRPENDPAQPIGGTCQFLPIRH